MHVGIVTTPIDYGPSGPSVYLENLCSALIGLDVPDVDLSFIHYEPSTHEIYEQANEELIPRTPVCFERGLAALDLDVLHYNYIPYRRPLVFNLPVPIVVTLHGDLAFALPEYAPAKFRYVSRPALEVYSTLGLLDRIDSYIAVSETLATNLSDALSIPAEKITTVYSGVEDRYRPIQNAAVDVAASFGISGPYLLNVNNYMKKKNRKTLIHAFNMVSDEHPNLSIVLAGGGWQESNIPEMIRKLGLTSTVTDLGFVSEDHLPALYSGAKALVNPTLHETFGLTNLEAMACGCPVVTSDRFAVPEIVGDGAILVEDPLRPGSVASATDELLTNDRARTALAQRGRDRASEFSWGRTAKGVLDVYRETLCR